MTGAASGGAREEILRRIRLANEIAGREAPAPRPPAVPELTNRSLRAHEERLDRFAENVADYRATVHRADAESLPAATAAALTEAGVGSVVVPDGLDAGWLSDLDPDVRVVADHGLTPQELDGIDAVITAATVGIARTGTIVLDHGPGQGRRALTLVPDVHVCVVTAEQVVDDVPDAITRLAPTAADAAQTWISGPSATSDIELDRVEGVHGPRTLVVVLVT